jgi:hypothetical protein
MPIDFTPPRANDPNPPITKLRNERERAKIKLMRAEQDGDDAGSEAWRGYLAALHWVEETLF